MRTGWIILRTARRHTLPLATSLASDGFDVWTPTQHEKYRGKQIVRPMLNGLVFAKTDRIADLIQLAEAGARAMILKARAQQPRGLKIGDIEHFRAGELATILAARAHAPFTVLRCNNKLAIVSEEDLGPVRRIERRRAKPVWAQRAFRKGQMVRARNGSGSFEGMVGFVKRSDTKATVVSFGGLLDRVEIPTSLLNEEEVFAFQSATDTAALKAA